MRIAIIGQGYVGLTITEGATSHGHQVMGIDINVSVVEKLNSGKSHVEGISSEAIAIARSQGLFTASSDFSQIEGSEVVVIAVPTPLDDAGKPDLAMLRRACESIAPFLNGETLVINESTSFIGTLRNFIEPTIRKINPHPKMFAISPERVDPGNAEFGVRNTPRLVGGLTVESAEKAEYFYSTFCKNVVRVSSPEVAEAAKLLENTFRFINIGFINEFAKLMNTMDISVSEVISAAGTKPYGFMPFFPNVGIGGHCIPVDPLYLQKNAEEIGMKSQFISLAESMNHEMPKYFVKRLEQLYGSVKGKSILVIGVSYKPNIADTRETPAEFVITELNLKGAKVSWHDPLVSTFMGQTSSPISGSYDLALILVKHNDLILEEWRGGPIYCVNEIPSHSEWIPVLSPTTNSK